MVIAICPELQHKRVKTSRTTAQLACYGIQTVHEKQLGSSRKYMKINLENKRVLGLEEEESFRYLGSIVDTRGGTEADVKTRISKSKGSISHFKKCVEVQGNRQNNENPFVQHKCQVCIAIRSRNLATEQDHAEKDPYFCKSVFAENIRNTVDGQSQ